MFLLSPFPKQLHNGDEKAFITGNHPNTVGLSYKQRRWGRCF
jgi:hypothetical protein